MYGKKRGTTCAGLPTNSCIFRIGDICPSNASDIMGALTVHVLPR